MYADPAQIHIPEAGTFLCSVTDLKFEVRAAVTIEYTYSSWDQQLSESVNHRWVVAGPVFDIRADPAEVAAVHLPHFICLQGGNIDTPQMEIAHIVDAGIMLEKPSQISPFHVVWKNPTFSLATVLINSIYDKFFAIHSVVQLYKIRKKTTTLHLYLIPNDGSLIEAVREEEEKYNSILVRKHPQTYKPLYFGSCYYVPNSAELTVNPKELEFSYKSPGQLQSFMEIYLRNCGRINLILKNKDNSVWDAWLEQVPNAVDDGTSCGSSGAPGDPGEDPSISSTVTHVPWDSRVAFAISSPSKLDPELSWTSRHRGLGHLPFVGMGVLLPVAG
ncbi:caspase recruitment domain-containing protein 8-like [Candoia aspera]|uniref:caspase recruitment domain-containing protein 8-like n=1 Tax=Candoia aspera TaxID=51853 RepID=UPI002FD82E20